MEGFADKLADAGVPVQHVPKRRPGQVWNGQAIPHPDSETMKKLRKAERDAARASEPQTVHATPANPPPKHETWEELQARLRRENEEKIKGGK